MSKEKGKSHPFVGYIGKAEEVLWMSAIANQVSVKAVAKEVISKMAIVFLILAALLTISSFQRGDGNDITPLLLLAVPTIFLCIPVIGAIVLIRVYRQRRLQHIYAVTNERLLYRLDQDVKTMELENVRAISIAPGNGAKGTLSFESALPMRPDIENAATFKQIVESFFPEDSAQGASGSVPFFPMWWPDVKNPAAVKQLIEEARSQRLQSAKQ